METKTKKYVIPTQYFLFGSLIFLFLVTIVFVTMIYVLRLERFLVTVDAPGSSFFGFHIDVLYFIIDYWLFIIIGILISTVIFELKYKSKNKSRIRFGTLLGATLLTNAFTITYLIAVIHLMITAIFCPKMKEMINKEREIPNKEAPANRETPTD